MADETKLPEVVQSAIDAIRAHLDDCNDIGEACAIEEALEELKDEYGCKGDDLADDEAAAELDG